MWKLLAALGIAFVAWTYVVSPRLASDTGPSLAGHWREVDGQGSLDLYGSGSTLVSVFGPGIDMVGSYRVEGDQIRFDLSGRPPARPAPGRDLFVPFSLEGGELRLELNGRPRRFRRKA
jgi:hypothetical protein